MGWFDTQALAQKAEAVAAEYVRLRASHAAQATAGKRQERRYDRLAAEAIAYSASLGINLYKKSRFVLALRAALAAGAVPGPEIDAFVARVVMGPLRRE